jgi:hypothetical protein
MLTDIDEARTRGNMSGLDLWMAVQMYTLVATVYEVGKYDRVTAVLWEGEQETGEPVTSAHLDLPAAGHADEGRHDVILRHIRLVCTELAQNFDEPMF